MLWKSEGERRRVWKDSPTGKRVGLFLNVVDCVRVFELDVCRDIEVDEHSTSTKVRHQRGTNYAKDIWTG